MLAIKTVDLTKKFKDVTAVNKLNMQVEEGELFALLGVNGAGKTTLIKMLSCLLVPTSGDGLLGSYSVLNEQNKVKKIIAISPQETAVAPNLTVNENLLLMCGVHGFSKPDSKIKTAEISKRLGLEEVSNKKAGKLSGGWQRRLSIAMALISEPQILFLDEPTLGLDVLARAELWDLINELKGEITIILTTHYMQEAEKLADRVGVMKSGELVAVGTVQQLKQQANTDNFEDAFIKIVKGGM